MLRAAERGSDTVIIFFLFACIILTLNAWAFSTHSGWVGCSSNQIVLSLYCVLVLCPRKRCCYCEEGKNGTPISTEKVKTAALSTELCVEQILALSQLYFQLLEVDLHLLHSAPQIYVCYSGLNNCKQFAGEEYAKLFLCKETFKGASLLRSRSVLHHYPVSPIHGLLHSAFHSCCYFKRA